MIKMIKMIKLLIDHLAWMVAKARMGPRRRRSRERLAILRCAKRATSAIGPEGRKEERAQGPLAPEDGCPDWSSRRPGRAQHRSSHITGGFSSAVVLFPKLSKLLNQENALSAPCSPWHPRGALRGQPHGKPGRSGTGVMPRTGLTRQF
jgi:hypothetical protein